MDELCACGLPLHYTDVFIEAGVKRQVAERGPDILVQVMGEDCGVFVPRHYIALHGVKGHEVAELARRYGWRFDR